MIVTDKNAAALLKLRWVAKVQRVNRQLIVTTKPGMLQTKVPNKVVVKGGTVTVGTAIKGGFWVRLPAYQFKLGLTSAQIKLATKPPDIKGEAFYPYPARTGKYSYDPQHWFGPCMGAYDNDYDRAARKKDYVGMAIAVAEYIQFSIPDSSLGIRLHSLFAYWIGLMPDKYVVTEKQLERAAAKKSQLEALTQLQAVRVGVLTAYHS